MNTDTCYTLPSVPGGHFRILSMPQVPGGHCTLTLVHGHDRHKPGERVFGVQSSDLRTCNCGRWRWPKQEAKR